MQRAFELHVVSAWDFDAYARQLGIPHTHSDAREKSFCLMDGCAISYTSPLQFAQEVYDGHQILRCIWFPGDSTIGNARKRTLYDSSYFDELLEKGRKYTQFIAELKKPENMKLTGTEDRLKFYRNEDDTWVLRYCKFRKPNFDLYEFGGLPNIEDLEEISAIRPID